jgi:selenocysteine-specific elongation factor
MKHFVLGTAGHVDHRKTALIKALTGVDTDRLKEKKKGALPLNLILPHLLFLPIRHSALWMFPDMKNSLKIWWPKLRSLGKKETIVCEKDNVRLAGHQVQLAGDLDSLRHNIALIYKEAGLTPPSLTDVVNDFKDQKAKAQSIIKLMLKDGDLIKINEELCFARESMNKLRDDYKAILVKDGKATPATFKDLTGLSRKYIIPLMEYFDVNKLTVRVGDHRILREKI